MGKVENVVFLSLVLDLFAFTIPLPLFPRIIEWYTKRESSDPNGFLSRTLWTVSTIRGKLYTSAQNSERWDVVLLGGLMGSAFSTLQFVVSPHIGSLSDKYGRRRVLLITMIGNIVSALVWIQSTTFASYMLSRVIGGLSEGNVQLAIAILSDITTPANRAKALAHVGIAFAICFCVGPPIGAYFASRPVTALGSSLGLELNVYAAPAILTLVLLVAETAFLAIALPETRGRAIKAAPEKTNGKASNGQAQETSRAKTVAQRISLLKNLRRLHFLFLGLFSGVEFTLTFLTFDLFDWSNTQNGKLIGSIGIISALLQGGYVRRALAKVGELNMARRGVSGCALGLVLLALLPHFTVTRPWLAFRLLQGAAVCMAFTSATVVNSLTAHASLQCDEATDGDTGKPVQERPELAKGQALGHFRSSGQLGRAIGPLLACASYWTFGPSITYGVSAVAMFGLSMNMRRLSASL
ncbi:MFS DHA1 sub-family [Dentipellis sp. KUC8613]|nr:MFS DHA1 sub-family [Dentipellis sp. KUC8613]